MVLSYDSSASNNSPCERLQKESEVQLPIVRSEMPGMLQNIFLHTETILPSNFFNA